jgi:hypothetical protein
MEGGVGDVLVPYIRGRNERHRGIHEAAGAIRTLVCCFCFFLRQQQLCESRPHFIPQDSARPASNGLADWQNIKRTRIMAHTVRCAAARLKAVHCCRVEGAAGTIIAYLLGTA